MSDYLRARRGKVALLLGGFVIGLVAANWQRAGAFDFDPWAID